MATSHTIEHVCSIDRMTIDTNPLDLFIPQYTSKINLQKGKQHLITAVDSFIDSNGAFYGTGASQGPQTLLVTIILSPYPAWCYANRTASEFYWPTIPAGNNNVFYKRVLRYEYDDTTSPVYTVLHDEEYPSITLADEDLRTFYTDHLYVSVFFGVYNVTDEMNVDNFQCSLLINMEEQDADPVSHAIGTIREFNDAQQLTNEIPMTLGNFMTNYSGYWSPAWGYGGIRPEIMVQSEQIALWLGSVEYAEEMVSRGYMQTFLTASRQMVPYDDAFGIDPGLGPTAPDWLHMMPEAMGVQISVRDEPVPVLKNVDGTTQMV